MLAAYSGADFWSVPSFDMLVAVTATLGHRMKLDRIVQATLDAKKTGDGIQMEWKSLRTGKAFQGYTTYSRFFLCG